MTIINNNIEIDNIKYYENETKKTISNNEPIEQKLHVIIVLSNPCNYSIKYILTKEFIRRMKDEPDIILYIIELAYGTQEYNITEPNNEKHLRLRLHNIPLWHKENLINIGIKRLLPNNWKAVAWVDADIEFESGSWALDTLKILNGYKDIVQLFSHNVFMDSSGDTDMILTGLAFQYIKKTKRSNRIKDINSYWHPGFAWACTRKLYEKMNGLYEYAITGDGDMQMASCFLCNYTSALPRDASIDYKKSLEEFENRVKGSRLGYVPGVIRHYNHNDRKYDMMRESILTKFNYSPVKHLCKNKDGILIPSENCPKEFIETIMNHFESKKEYSSIQKDFITNIQNNLHIIYDKPVYSNLVKEIYEISTLILVIVNNSLPENNLSNEHITEKIIEDVIYKNIFNNIDKNLKVERNVYVDKNCSFYNDPLYNKLNKIVNHITKHKKNYTEFILYLIEEIYFIISSFELHNLYNNELKLKAYNFGSTSSVYISGDGDYIIKVYNKRLRWSYDNHNNIIDIYKKELEILLKLNLELNLELNFDEEKLLIQMDNKGESLYNNFILPYDYKKQIINIFNLFDSRNIYYPEFNLNNIIISHDGSTISFIDYGLAKIISDDDDKNDENCKNFIELLEILNDKLFINMKDKQQIKMLYNTFMVNMKNNKKYTRNIF
jgi:hypothetical protein